MTLSFKKTYKGYPTFFPHKILVGLLDAGVIDEQQLSGLMAALLVHCPDCIMDLVVRPKVHTIRTDEKDLWQVNKAIHFVIGNRTAARYQFAPIVKVKRIDEIFMTFDDQFHVTVNDRYLNDGEIERLALNDGFDGMDEMAEWFFPHEKVEKVSGKIIHWTEGVEYE